MGELTVRYIEPYRCEMSHPEHGVSLVTTSGFDGAPVDSFSPVELFALSLGSCLLTTIAIAARVKFDLDLGGSSVSVATESTRKPKNRVERFTLTFDLPVKVTGRQRDSLERAHRACPVHNSLSDDVEVTTAYRWGEVTGD